MRIIILTECAGLFSALTPINLDEIPNDPGKMFIGGLSWQTTPENVREYFSQFGDVAEVMVMKDPATRRSRGFGFITFSNPGSVNKVLAYPAHQLDGKLIEPKVRISVINSTDLQLSMMIQIMHHQMTLMIATYTLSDSSSF